METPYGTTVLGITRVDDPDLPDYDKWLVWCNTCDRQLGDAVPYEWAEKLAEAHTERHAELA